MMQEIAKWFVIGGFVLVFTGMLLIMFDGM